MVAGGNRNGGGRPWAARLLVVLLLTTPPAAVSPAAASNLWTTNSTGSTTNNLASMRGFDPALLTGIADPHPNTSNLMVGDPSNPHYYLEGSTQFGFGLVSGASNNTICQNRIDCTGVNGNPVPVPAGGAAAQTGDPGYYYLSYMQSGNDGSGNPLLKQGLRNDALSDAVAPTAGCGSLAAAAGQKRCNQFDVGFHQEVALIGDGSAAAPRGDGDQIFDLFFSIDSLTDADGNLIGEAKGTVTEAYTDVTAGITTSAACTGTFSYSAATGYTQLTGPQGECK